MGDDVFYDAVDWQKVIERKDEDLKAYKRQLDREKDMLKSDVRKLERKLRRSEEEEAAKDGEIERLRRKVDENDREVVNRQKTVVRLEHILSDTQTEVEQLKGDRCRMHGWIQDKDRALEQLDRENRSLKECVIKWQQKEQEAVEREEKEKAVKLQDDILRQQIRKCIRIEEEERANVLGEVRKVV